MQANSRKYIVIALACAILIALGALYYLVYLKAPDAVLPGKEKAKESVSSREVIGRSVEGRDIESVSYGKGDKEIIFVGGIHGGYEWNSVMLAYKVMDYLEANPDAIPPGLKVTVIPSLNPDGVYKVTGKEGRFALADVSTDKEVLASGRFNGNNVDINRNFDCKWQPKSTWQTRTVSAGTKAFSEPEAEAMRDYALKEKPAAVVFWHSQSNAVYASECKDGILPETTEILNLYSKASGYPAAKSFTSYAITGDSGDWLSSIGIPSISVELKTHETIEYEKNLAGVLALIKYFGDSI